MGKIVTSLVEALLYWGRDERVEVWTPEGLRPIPYARNYCAKRFMDSKHSYLWFIDADTTPTRAALDMLLQADKSMISGLYPLLKMDTDGLRKRVNIVCRRNGAGELKAATGSGVEPIDACGTGCLMIRREVFEQIEFPWFVERSWGEVRGSDFTFCERVRAAGIPIYAHFEVQCRHRKEVDL